MAWKKGFKKGYGNKVKAPFFKMLHKEERNSPVHIGSAAYYKKDQSVLLEADSGMAYVKKGEKNYGQALKALGFMKRSKNFKKLETTRMDGSGDKVVMFDEIKPTVKK